MTDIKCNIAGFTTDQLKEFNPDIIYELLSGFGYLSRYLTLDQLKVVAAKVKETIG